MTHFVNRVLPFVLTFILGIALSAVAGRVLFRTNFSVGEHHGCRKWRVQRDLKIEPLRSVSETASYSR